MFEETLIVSEEVKEICEKCLCQLYGSKHHIFCDLSYHLFCARQVEIELHLFPPSNTRNIPFSEHALQSNLQSFVWKSCLQQRHNLQRPVDMWTKKGELCIHWSDEEPGFNAILQFISTSFKTSCLPDSYSFICNTVMCAGICHNFVEMFQQK